MKKALPWVGALSTLCLILSLCMLNWNLNHHRPPAVYYQPVITGDPFFRLDLNQASALELETLPGIGEVLAQRILDLRQELGGYTDVTQLQQIKGLSGETFQEIMPMVTVGK